MSDFLDTTGLTYFWGKVKAHVASVLNPHYGSCSTAAGTAAKTVTISGEPKKLTSMEFSLLCYLIENPDRLITKAELFDNVWKDKFTSDGTLNVHIRKLREAIEEDPKKPSRIQTVWKEGYKDVTGAGR